MLKFLLANWELHPPYFTTQDLTDWQWVTIRPLQGGESLIRPYDLPTLRGITELALGLPRVGFYTTPAFLALWNTNNSNQHRVTANQTLLVAFGQSFTPDSLIAPINPTGLDQEHSVEGTACYGCHKNLDPLREFWSGHFDFSDRNDFPNNTFLGGVANPRPDSPGGTLAFGNVNNSGTSIYDLGSILLENVDGPNSDSPTSRFALAFTQKLCFYANSFACVESDPEFRRVAAAFESSSYDFLVLVKELFSSPLVSDLASTQTAETNGITVSVVRREHLCAALSARTGVDDICSLGVPAPNAAQQATRTIAASIPADAFSRGSETPVTPSKPTLFYRAATEMLCEDVASRVVDTDGSRYSSSDPDTTLPLLVETIMGYTSGDPKHDRALEILRNHLQAAQDSSGGANPAMRSTFALACQSPSSLAFGL